MGVRAEGLEPSSSLEHRPLKPACLPIPPRPRLKRIEPSKQASMSTPDERERESRESPETKYEEELERESEERHEVAERLKRDPPREEEDAER